jgi:hypothetical protein
MGKTHFCINIAREAGARVTKFLRAGSLLCWLEEEAEIETQTKKGGEFLGWYFEGAEIMTG